MEGAHAGDTTWTKVERKAKGKKVFLGRHDQDKSKKVYVDKSSNYVAKGEPAMKGINVVESALHISKGNQVLKQARNFKLASSGFTSAQGVTGGKQGPGSERAGAYSQGAETSKTPFKSNLKRLRPNSLQNSPVENGHTIYASPVPSKREEAWRVLTDFSRNYSGPLLAIGDFNEILLSSEVKGGNFVSRRAERFGALLDECGLIDLGAHGSLYTWFRHMQGNRFISKRLDRAVATDAWCFRFPESYVENLARMHSDHCPIMIRCQGNDRRVGVRDDALAFNRDVFGNIFKRKRELERRVTSIQQRMERVDALSLIQEERELQAEYSNLLMQEELFWYQKSREHWVRFGDRNTKFFHMQTIMRRKRNKVQGLFLEDGRWSTDPQELEECAIGFYRDLFCNVEQVELDVMGDQELPSLSREAIESLTRNVSKEEVRKVVMGMNSFKAPGADGFQAFFFKEYWEVVGTEVWELVKKAFAGFDLDSALFDTLVVLIPKVDNPSRMKEFRPISLCNVIYKIITKVVVERLRPFLQDIIGPLQGEFIPGRGAPDNIIVAQEVFHFMKKTK
ncbi:hypothetical protein AHAS_Ahas15G0066400 [Arachis hypogaea]